MKFTSIIKKVGVMALATLVGGAALFSLAEPTVVRGQQTDTDDVTVNLTVDAGISITDCGTDVTMTDDNTDNMSQTVDIVVAECDSTVETNHNAGYKLEVEAASTPAMQHNSTNDEFADYTVASGTTEQWSVSSAYEFGFSAAGTHVDDTEYDNGNTTCDTAATLDSGSSLNYRGFNGTTKIEVATDSSPTDQGGVTTKLCFGAEQDTVLAPSGSYSAVVTQTATTL